MLLKEGPFNKYENWIPEKMPDQYQVNYLL